MSFPVQLESHGVTAPDWSLVAEGPWLIAMPAGAVLPDQGWKLHLSATVASAAELLDKALPHLVRTRTAFKLARSIADLSNLNEGLSGLSQVGKFITIYPPDDDASVALAMALDDLTRDVPGPEIPSDMRLCDGSAVHYRYGGFTSLSLRLSHGETVPAIRNPQGALEPDRRGESYAAPDWAADPFTDALARAGKTRTPPPHVVAGRYVLTAAISHSPRGRIFLAIDLVAGARAVLKEARRGAAASTDGRDAGDLLRAEAHALRSIGPKPYLPKLLGLEQAGASTFLALEDVGGRSLASVIAEARARGIHPPWQQVEAWANELVHILCDLHAAGWLHRDLKPTNVMLRPDGQLVMIDLELAAPVASQSPADGRGTPGYMSPAQKSGATPSPADDIYGFGALMYFLATSGDPGQTPRAAACHDRPMRSLRPDLPDWFVAIIEACLRVDPAPAFATIADVAAALRTRTPPAGLAEEAEPADLASLLRRTVTGLEVHARLLSRTEADPAQPLDINTGLGGQVLALADLIDPDDAAAAATLQRAAFALLQQAGDGRRQRLPGLYVGDSGIAVALLRAAQVLDDRALRDGASALMRAANRLETASPDLFNGMAGQLLANLLFFDDTRERAFLLQARRFGDGLIAAATEERPGEMSWVIPDGFSGLSGKRHAGYSHGAAGIADVLLDLHDVTGDAPYAEAALAAARWLARIAEPSGPAGDGLEWPIAEGGLPVGPMWCHGAAGIARFFLHLHESGLAAGSLDVARRAMASVMGPGRALGPTRCHGLAGSIEILLDMERVTGERIHADHAMALGRLLPCFALQVGEMTEWCGDQPSTLSADYMTGGAGIAVALQRLLDPRRGHQLSRQGFGWRQGGAAPQRVSQFSLGGRQ